MHLQPQMDQLIATPENVVVLGDSVCFSLLIYYKYKLLCEVFLSEVIQHIHSSTLTSRLLKNISPDIKTF